METSEYYLEFRLESKPDVWKRSKAFHFKKLIEAEAYIKECLERQKENAETNFITFKDRVLQYRVVCVNVTTRETILSFFDVTHPKLIQHKKDELYYLKQLFKYLKHLERLYISSKIADTHKLWRTGISISNVDSEIKQITKNLEELTGRSFKDEDSDS